MVLETASRVSDEAKNESLDAEDPAPESEGAEPVEPVAPPSKELLTPERVALLRKVVPAVWFGAVLLAGFVSGVELAFLVAAAGVLTLVITLMWSSVQSLTGGASIGFEEALGMGAPSKVEEQKRAILRALNDLKFELGVGKISQADFQELSAKYRDEARRLMQTLDETLDPARQQVEQRLKQRLAQEGLSDALDAPTEKLPETTDKSRDREEVES
jgi:hypothetical protein